MDIMLETDTFPHKKKDTKSGYSIIYIFIWSLTTPSKV